MEVWSTYVLYLPGEGVWPSLLLCPGGTAPFTQWPYTRGHLVSVRVEQEYAQHCWYETRPVFIVCWTFQLSEVPFGMVGDAVNISLDFQRQKGLNHLAGGEFFFTTLTCTHKRWTLLLCTFVDVFCTTSCCLQTIVWGCWRRMKILGKTWSQQWGFFSILPEGRFPWKNRMI